MDPIHSVDRNAVDALTSDNEVAPVRHSCACPGGLCMYRGLCVGVEFCDEGYLPDILKHSPWIFYCFMYRWATQRSKVGGNAGSMRECGHRHAWYAAQADLRRAYHYSQHRYLPPAVSVSCQISQWGTYTPQSAVRQKLEYK